MVESTVLHSITPDQLAEIILKGVEAQFNALKEEQRVLEQNKFLTRKETAEMLRISLGTLHARTRNGTLTAHKLGNKTYYRRGEIESVLANSNRK